MSVAISEISALDASKMTVYSWDKQGNMIKDDGSGGKTVVPAATTPSGPLPAVVPPKGIDQGVNVPAAATVKTSGGYVSVPVKAREEIDEFLPSHPPFEKRSVPTWAWVAGGTVAVLVTYMLLKPTRGIQRSAPATAGLGRLQRGRKSRPWPRKRR